MKKSFYYIFASLLLLVGCSDRLNVAEPILDGEIAVNLGVEGPMAIGTRSYVSGSEVAINAIKMLCFDAGGAYITSRDATVSPTGDFSGTLTGSVPANTARIHFIANFNEDISSISMGKLERVVMKDVLFSSGVTDPVCFWGYHKESSSEAMAGFLNNISNPNKIVLIRDRAKVVVVNEDPDIASIKWTISHGLKRGFIAAVSSTDNNNPYDNNYVNNTVLTEYRSSQVYDEEDSDYMDSGAVWADENEPQFLFENANSTEPVKVIVEATFNNGDVRYHTILLQDNNGRQYRVLRNQTFTLTLKELPDASVTAIGSATFAEAVATTNFSNNPYSQVAREVNEISNEEFTLAVEKVMVIFNSGTTGTVNFTYRSNNGSPVTQTNFTASWEPKADDDQTDDVTPVTTNPTISYNGTTGQGTITFSLNEITSDLKYNALQLVSPSGLTRYVDVYSITSFSYAEAPVFEKVNGTTRTVGGVVRQVYKLTFTIPGNLPKALYPITVRMYTSTLVPYSDATAATPHGSFNVVTKTTDFLTGGDQPAYWNYDANNWGYWYEYSIDAPSNEADRSFTIYLYDMSANYSRTINTVGLFLEIPNFGARRQFSANR